MSILTDVMKIVRWISLTGVLAFGLSAVVGAAVFQSVRLQPADAAVINTFSLASSTRFISGNSDYLSKTFSTTPTDRAKKTVSLWVKRSALSAEKHLFSSYNGGGQDGLFLNSSDKLQIYAMGGGAGGTVNGVLRDPAAWYHVVYVIDTTQATAGDRLKIWINGTNYPSGSWTSYSTPSLNSTADILFYQSTEIGRDDFASSGYLDGYMSDVYFVDGQALFPSSFGVLNQSGVWVPIAYTGTYGTNGFHLPLMGTSTAASVGTDTSGNGNYWTVNNIATTDFVIDTPTNNFTTMSLVVEGMPNFQANSLTWGGTLTEGNLKAIGSANGTDVTGSTIAFPSTGKYYFEGKYIGSDTAWIGIANIFTAAKIIAYRNNGSIAQNADTFTGSFSTYVQDDVIGVAVDMDNASTSFYKNNVYQATVSLTRGITYMPLIFGGNAVIGYYMNFGQGGQSGLSYDAASGGYFKYTPPSGFKALSVPNLPGGPIDRPSDYFNVKTYTGSSTAQSIGDFNFAPDLVWIKATSTTADHGLFDSIRGAGAVLISNRTNAEAASSTAFSAFTSNGFTLGAFGAFNNPATTTAGGGKYVSWAWKESATAGFDIVTYTGNGANRTIPHSLGRAADFIIIKDRTGTNDWAVYHSSNTTAPATDYLLLNSTAATADDDTYWNDTQPTASVFSVGTNVDVNTNTNSYVAYLFASTTGFSSFGSYTGNASADGPFVYTGFKPRFVMIKSSTATDAWLIYDTARNTYNVAGTTLVPNTTAADATISGIDFLSNGFKLRTITTTPNAAQTYMYAAFAELPLAGSSGPSNYIGTTITRNTNFRNSLYVAGAVAKGSGTFVIDHPLDPENKLLYHSFVESPDMKNVYDGVAELNDNGEATIELPSYFLKLNKDFRYLATPMGGSMPDLHLRQEAGKKYLFGAFGPPVIRIAGGTPNGRVSWQVTGIRQDPVAVQNPVIVEVNKDQTDFIKKGELLHPEAFGN